MALIISPKILAKLLAKTPPVTKADVEQCFANRNGCYGIDTRAKHLTNPYTRWFIAETDFGVKLKIAFVPQGKDTCLRTAYAPNADELALYLELCRSTKNQ